MPLSIKEVTYAYPITTIGVENIATASINGNTIEDIREAYKNLFADYSGKADILLNKLNGILVKNLSFSDLENIEAIFDNDDIIAEELDEAGKYKECKEGIKAYRFYLKEIITKLYDLHNIITQANKITGADEEIGALSSLYENEDVLNDKAHELITQLQIYDKQAQDILKVFSEYAVIKNLTVSKEIKYNDGIEDKTDEQTDSYESIEKAYRSWGNNDPNASTDNLTDKTKDCSTIEDLRNIQTDKQEILRKYTTTYYKVDDKGKECLADKYDLLAKIKVTSEDIGGTSDTSSMALFDELTLLEKLQYIRIYYKDEASKRYVYPQDNSYGFPCVQPPESTDAIKDTQELGHVEMFYLGYIINRDGPINALASFLEIKTTAIQSQIKVLMKRVGAIQAYSTLLQKGYEQLSSVASDYGNIPKAAFYIYRYLSTSSTRCFYYINNEPYIMVQYSHANKGSFNIDEGKEPDSITSTEWNWSPNGQYILVKATDKGLNNFVTFLNAIPLNQYEPKHDRALDYLFYGEVEPKDDDLQPEDNEFYTYKKARLRCDVILDVTGYEGDILFLYAKPSSEDSEEKNEKLFPKQLDVPKVPGTSLTDVPYQEKGKWAWNNLNDAKNKKNVLPAFFSAWEGNYETQIANYKTNLDQQQKEITTLQKKIQTFDATSTNFRNKAFTIYNKIVNKIK